jgi:hypothetical protein
MWRKRAHSCFSTSQYGKLSAKAFAPETHGKDVHGASRQCDGASRQCDGASKGRYKVRLDDGRKLGYGEHKRMIHGSCTSKDVVRIRKGSVLVTSAYARAEPAKTGRARQN